MKRKKGTYSDPKIISDPEGSYTGIPMKETEQPIQDADDL